MKEIYVFDGHRPNEVRFTCHNSVLVHNHIGVLVCKTGTHRKQMP